MQGFRSNNALFLIKKLHEELIDCDVFTRRVVIVSNLLMKNWLQLQLATYAGIATGIEIVTERQAISLLVGRKDLSFPSTTEFCFAIEKLLVEKNHLYKFFEKSEPHLFAHELSALFNFYSAYGKDICPHWQHESGWQQSLWLTLFERHPRWKKLFEAYRYVQPSPYKIAVFGVNLLLPPLYDLLRHYEVSYFLLSVCQHFWGDIQTDRQRFCSIENSLETTNFFAANYGMMGRRATKQLEELELEGYYFVPRAAVKEPKYVELIHPEDSYLCEEERASLSSLQTLQMDILLLTESRKEVDDSIQFHAAATFLRETEVLYNNILHLIKKCGYLPSDFLVMAPDITDYIVAIKATFSKLPYQIVGTPLQWQESVVGDLLELLSISTSDWSTKKIVGFLCRPAISSHMNLTIDDLKKVEKWFEEVSITWGFDANHRQQILERSHCYGVIEQTTGTWQEGLFRLKEELLTGKESTISFSDSELLGRLVGFLNSLREDLAPLSSKKELSVRDWCAYIKSLISTYITDDSAVLDPIFFRLEKSAHLFSSEKFPFSSISFKLKKILSHEKSLFSEGNLQSVQFGSIKDLVGQPAKVIALMGMQEGSFPSPSSVENLSLFNHLQVNYCPSLPELDRYYFLLTLLLTKHYLLISYQNINHSDGKRQESASAVKDLLHYLFAEIVEHPFYSFDFSYFLGEKLFNYREEDYRVAVAKSTLPPRKPFVSFLPPMEKKVETKPLIQLDISDLYKSIKNPIALFFAAHRFFYEEKSFKEESLTLTPLVYYQFKQILLHRPLIDVLEEMGHKLPLGSFAKLVKTRLTDQAATFRRCFNKFSVDELYQFEFALNCHAPRQVDALTWQLPSPVIEIEEGVRVALFGQLSDISLQGVVLAAKAENRHMLRNWPSLLLLEYVSTHSIDKKIIFAESISSSQKFTSSGCHYLKELVTYTLQSKKQLSPLLDCWITDFIKRRCKAALHETLITSLYSDYFYNKEAKWLFAQQFLEPSLLEKWQLVAQKLFNAPLLLMKK